MQIECIEAESVLQNRHSEESCYGNYSQLDQAINWLMRGQLSNLLLMLNFSAASFLYMILR